MRLTQQQVDQMKAKGLDDKTIAELAKQKGYELPDTRDTLTKANTAVQKFGFAGGKVGEAIGTLGGYALEKAKGLLGGKDNSQYYDLSAPSPLQVAGDIAKGAVQVAGAKMPISGSILGKTGQFGALGAASGATNAIAEGKSAGDVVKDTVSEGVKGALTGFTFGTIEKGLVGATKLINQAGEKIQAKVIVPTKADIDDGFALSTLKKYDLGGTLKQTFEKTNAKMDSLTKELNTKLATNNTAINLNKVFENTKAKIGGSKLQNFGTNTQMGGALERLQSEILDSAGKNGLVSIPEAQIVKRASGHLGAWNFANTAPEAKASEKVFNAFYTELKNEIEKVSPEGVREINKQLSEMIPVLNAVIRRMPVAERNAIIGLPEMVTLVGSTIQPGALALTAANLAQKSGRVGNALTKVKGLGQGVASKAEQVAQSLVTH